MISEDFFIQIFYLVAGHGCLRSQANALSPARLYSGVVDV